ncbi:MAG: tRNA glutamyl-Q(34) synthetase GluQRS [bacterium]
MSSDAQSSGYIGRFAPSPTGPLHFGSLVSAIASYLDARANRGKWLLRIDDIDPPREEEGATDTIFRQLENHGLYWDGEALFQSQRSEAYRSALETLKAENLIFPCTCSRQTLDASGGSHFGVCWHSPVLPQEPYAWRLSVENAPEMTFADIFQGVKRYRLQNHGGDYVLLRKDGLFAYQLACGLDEIYQGVTHVIRGVDLMESTPRQIYLQQMLGFTSPIYGHIPVATDASGNKLSKQNLAPSLDASLPGDNVYRALIWIGLVPPAEIKETPEGMLAWAETRWQRDLLVGQSAKRASRNGGFSG